MLSNDYNAWALGLGHDLNLFGAMSVDITQSIARLPGEPTASGMSFKVNYAKHFDELNSQITFAGYRFSQRRFMNMSQYLQERYNADNGRYYGRQKEPYILTASKTFDNVMLNFSVPIGDRRNIGYSLQATNNDVTQMASYNDYTDPKNTWQVSGGFNQSGKQLAHAYYTHNASFGSLNASVAYQLGSYSSVSGTFRGGPTAARHGVAAHQNTSNGGSRIMLDTDGIAGVPINDDHTYSNRFGLVVISDITSYYNTDTSVDVNTLADDIEATRAPWYMAR